MLRHLEELHLQTNGMQGSLPMVLGTLGNLVWLGLSENQFTGELPPNLGDLVQLGELCVSTQERRAQGETHSWLCVCVFFFAAVFWVCKRDWS